MTYSSSNNPAQRIPCSLIKPVQKIVKAMRDKMMGGAIVEPVKEQMTSQASRSEVVEILDTKERNLHQFSSIT